MKFVSLFAGVGGFDLGFERSGMECVGQVEIDKKCIQILEQHWPNVPKHEDVITAREWADEQQLVGTVDLVCGGFPCQDVSVAGRRAGLAGERTGLFWNALAFATHVQARWIVLENVPGLLSSNNGRDFGVVLSALADSGYRHLEWKVLDSQFFGIPQRRRRVFVVASSQRSNGRAVFVEPESLSGDFAQDGKKEKSPSSDLRSIIAFSHTQGLDIQPSTTAWPTLRVGGGGQAVGYISSSGEPTLRKLSPIECERLQGFPDDWTAGLADSHRYKQMGNAVTVNVAHYVGSLIMNNEITLVD